MRFLNIKHKWYKTTYVRKTLSLTHCFQLCVYWWPCTSRCQGIYRTRCDKDRINFIPFIPFILYIWDLYWNGCWIIHQFMKLWMYRLHSRLARHLNSHQFDSDIFSSNKSGMYVMHRWRQTALWRGRAELPPSRLTVYTRVLTLAWSEVYIMK